MATESHAVNAPFEALNGDYSLLAATLFESKCFVAVT